MAQIKRSVKTYSQQFESASGFSTDPYTDRMIPPLRTQQTTVISNHWGNKEELSAEVDCGIIVNQCDSLTVIVRFKRVFTVCCMLDMVTESCTLYMG